MGLPHVTLDLRERFRAEVVDLLDAGYAAGATPNPCVAATWSVRFTPCSSSPGALLRARHGPLRLDRADAWAR